MSGTNVGMLVVGIACVGYAIFVITGYNSAKSSPLGPMVSGMGASVEIVALSIAAIGGVLIYYGMKK